MVVERHPADTAVLSNIVDGDFAQRLRLQELFRLCAKARFVVCDMLHLIDAAGDGGALFLRPVRARRSAS